MVFIQVVRGRPGGRLQLLGGGSKMTWLGVLNVNDISHFHYRQESFMESYIASQRESIFRNVEVLIYVFDVESRELERDFHYYQSCLEAILQNSADAKVFCLIHKMDLIHQDEADRVMRG